MPAPSRCPSTVLLRPVKTHSRSRAPSHAPPNCPQLPQCRSRLILSVTRPAPGPEPGVAHFFFLAQAHNCSMDASQSNRLVPDFFVPHHLLCGRDTDFQHNLCNSCRPSVRLCHRHLLNWHIERLGYSRDGAIEALIPAGVVNRLQCLLRCLPPCWLAALRSYSELVVAFLELFLLPPERSPRPH